MSLESLKLFANDLHCRRLLFGCSHDNGYARVLEECSDRAEQLKKVVLLEGVPFQKELVGLPFSTKKFPGLFLESKIVVSACATSHMHSPTPAKVGSSSHSSKTYNVLSGLPTRFPPSIRSTSDLMTMPPSTTIVPLIDLPWKPSTSTLASTDIALEQPTVKTMYSWAAKAAAPPPLSPEAPIYQPANRQEVIARNRAGHRIDPPCKDYDKAEVDRVKKIKMCNVHFLRRECPYGAQCTHLHTYAPTTDEMSTLRLVARMAPCQNGGTCEDIRCIYGHRCPAPLQKTNRGKGTKSCIFGEACKFPVDLHNIDTNVVKTLVVR